MIAYKTLIILVFLLAPAAVLWLCRRVKWCSKIGPVLLLYLIGLLIGNLNPVPIPGIQDTLTSVMVPLAIPLMLLGCSFRKSETRSQLLALVTGFLAVTIAVAGGYLIFGPSIDAGAQGADTAANIGGMMMGVYTGGTINLASLKTMLGVSEETYLLLNGYDVIVCLLYLTFLMGIGIKLFRKFLPCETLKAGADGNGQSSTGTSTGRADTNLGADTNRQQGGLAASNPYAGLWSKAGAATIGKLIGIVAVICGLSYAVTLLLPSAQFMTVFILALTTFSIGASFIPAVRKLPYAYDLGMYCIYIFCIVVASMANFTNLNLMGSLGMLGYLTLVIFGSLLLQVLFAKIFRIDSDTMVVSSVAFICSPPFVPMMVAAMKNRRVLVAGLWIGIIGYAAGNYLGVLMARVLSLL